MKQRVPVGSIIQSIFLTIFILAGFMWTIKAYAEEPKACTALLNHTTTRLAEKEEVDLCSEFRDKVVLVVNTASRCAFTSQYEGLEKLYATYQEKGFVVAGFPSNDFAGQEPGNENEIKNFCRTTYGVKFPMFAKSHVKGDRANPFYAALIAESGESPMWNFHKYLIGRDGKVAATFSSFTGPDSEKLITRIESLLAE